MKKVTGVGKYPR